jgi:hypothetical protein
MNAWGVLSTHGADASTLRRWYPLLRETLGGLVATGPRSAVLAACRWEGPELAESPLQCLLAGLRGVPDQVANVVFLEGLALETLATDEVAQMLGWLTPGVSAVVRGAPVTDALKRVEGDRVVGPVERDGLLTLQTPHVIRRDALDEALLVLPDGGPQDPAALLIATGHHVRMFHPAPAGVRAPQADVPHLAR